MELISLKINGRCCHVAVEKNWNLLYVLREVLDMTGTKCGCDTNDCGACKIIIDGEAVTACSVKAVNAAGKDIETIEGLSRDGQHLHPIQQAYINCGAVQCGFCTPGMVMASKALLDKTLTPTEEQIREALKGNLCRCTGYVKIVEAVKRAGELLMEEGKNNGM